MLLLLFSFVFSFFWLQDVDVHGVDGSELEGTLLQGLRSKCVIQLLLLGALDSLQVIILGVTAPLETKDVWVESERSRPRDRDDDLNLTDKSVDGLWQKNHWMQLQTSHKRLIMDTILSMVDFAASYNSDSNLRSRFHLLSGDRYILLS